MYQQNTSSALKEMKMFTPVARHSPSTTKISNEHIAVISSTYYFNRTGSYPAHTVVTLFNAKSYDTPPPFNLLCTSTNGNATLNAKASIVRMQKDMKQCAWTQYIAVCSVIPHIESFAVKDTSLPKEMAPPKIPVRYAVGRKVGVAMCFSPLYYFDRWQLLLLSLEVYRQHGVNIQVYYVESAISSIMDVLKVYEQKKLVHIEPWSLIEVNDNKLGYNPNEELNWRNQPAAVTDCVLNFKASADFIIVGDVDDIVFPNLGRTYSEEFNSLLTLTPDAAGFIYQRYNSPFKTTHRIEDFSLGDLLSNTEFTNEFVGPKSVVIPSRVQTVWQHFPLKIEKGYRMVKVPEPTNLFLHFRQWKGVDRGSGWQRNYTTKHNGVYRMTDIVSHDRAHEIQHGFEAFIKETGSARVFNQLPQKAYYYETIYNCFFQLYYKFYMRAKDVKRCPGPGLCNIPAIAGLNCHVSKRNFAHRRIGDKLFIHYSQSSAQLEIYGNGCGL